MKCIWLLGLLLPAAAEAEVFKCRDEHGHISYNGHACPPGSQRLVLGGASVSVVAPSAAQQQGVDAYRRERQHWLQQQEQQRQASEKARALDAKQHWRQLAREKERCGRLQDSKQQLQQGLASGLPLKEFERHKARLAKVDAQMQDGACHRFNEDS